MTRTSLTVIALCAALLCTGAAQAAPNPTLTCQQGKLSTQGRLELCLAQNSAAILNGAPDNSAACQAALTAALAQIDAAAAQAGTSCRYLDNGADPVTGDDTISDLNTGLMWEKQTGTPGNPSTGRVDDVNNSYTWSTGDNLPDGTAFTSFLATLNDGASTDGGVSTPITGCFVNHCDWRLPSIVELQGIVDLSTSGCGSGGPCIDPTFGPTQPNFYWSATTFAELAGSAWGPDFNVGLLYDDLETLSYYVRAVRSGL